MSRVVEGHLALIFPDDWDVTKYDDWAFYRKAFNSCCTGNKAVDFLCFEPDERILWMIELKDFRGDNSRTNPALLWEDVAVKVRDTLAGLFAAKVDVHHDQQTFASKSFTAKKIRVVLHLEQTVKTQRPYDRADVQQKLKQLIKPIDAHPLVIELTHMRVPWEAEAI